MKTETQHALTKDLRPDPEQPRKTFPPDPDFDESTKLNGIVEALTVREDPEKKTKWLIVAGERRWRRAVELKLERVPIAPREFANEKELRNFQRIVDTQRLNLSDLDRAADLDRELKRRQKGNPKFSISDLGAALGIPRATIYESFKLLKLSPPIVAAMKKGELDASKARLLAIVPAEKHAGLLKYATEERYNSEPPSVRMLAERIERQYCRQLSAAPWKHADAELVKSAGPCSTCPKRSGNIEGMEGNPNICTDTKCFASKQTAHTMRVLSEAKAAGRRTVPSEEYARKRYSSFTKAEDKCYDEGAKGRTLAQLAKAAQIAPAVTVDEEGQPLEVFTNDDVAKIKKAAGIKERSYSGGGRNNAAAKAYQKKKKQFTAAAQAATATILEKEVGLACSAGLWKLMCRGAYHATDIEKNAFVAKRRGLARGVNEAREGLKKWIDQTTDGRELARMTVELLVCASWDKGRWQTCDWSNDFKAACKLAGVNLDKLLKTHSAAPIRPPARAGRGRRMGADESKTKTKKGKKQ